MKFISIWILEIEIDFYENFRNWNLILLKYQKLKFISIRISEIEIILFGFKNTIEVTLIYKIILNFV